MGNAIYSGSTTVNRFPVQQSPLLQYLRQIGALSNAGGYASGSQGLSGVGGNLTSLANLISGIRRGGPAGYASAGLSGAKLYDSATGTQASPLLGAAGSALGLYNNIKQGGVQGDLGAALNAAQLYGTAGGAMGAPGAAAVGTYAGAAALPLALFAAQYALFNKQSQVSPEDMARTATEGDVKGPKGVMTTKASLMPYNQPGESWQPRGYDPQAIGQAQAKSDQALANSYRTGQYLNPITHQEVAWDPNSDGPPKWQANLTGVPVNMRPSGGDPYIHPAARGGHMRSTDLKNIYRGPMYRDRIQHFDSGGSYHNSYGNYYNTSPAAYNNYSAQQLREMGGTGNNIASQYAGQANPQMPTLDQNWLQNNIMGTETPQYINGPNGLMPNPNYDPLSSQGQATDINTLLNSELTGTSLGSEPGGSGNLSLNLPGGSGGGYGGSTPQGSLAGLLQSLGMGAGLAGNLSSLMPLLPLLSAAVGSPTPPKQPTLPSQYQSPAINITPPNFSMTPNPAYQGKSMNDWLHIAEQPGGMQPFYQNNMLPATQNSAPNQQAQWGAGPGGGMQPPPPPSAAPPSGGPNLNQMTLQQLSQYSSPTQQNQAPPAPGNFGVPGYQGSVDPATAARNLGIPLSQFDAMAGMQVLPMTGGGGMQPLPQSGGIPYPGSLGGGPNLNQMTLQQLSQYSDPTQQSQAPPMANIQPILPHFPGGRLPSSMMAHGGSTYVSPHYVSGPGDGTSDDINAKLSNGEYVFDAPTVSLLGNGSNEAGAKALDQMRINVRKHAGAKLKSGKQPMSAKRPEQYLNAEYV